MRKYPSKALIGAFVLGAIALIIAAVMVFGSGMFLRRSERFVLFFDGSVKGLQQGSTVVFRGVSIGEVTRIMVKYDPKDLSVYIPVYIRVYPDRIVPLDQDTGFRKETDVNALIRKGLKGQLQLQSFLTGQLIVNLDFYPDRQIRLMGLDKNYDEIPTTLSGQEELTRKLGQMPLAEIAHRLNNTLAGLDKIVNSADTQASMGTLHKTIKDVDKLVKEATAELEPLTSQIKGTTDAARSAFTQAEKTLTLKEGPSGEIAASLQETLKASRVTLEQTREALSNIERIGKQNANVGYEINRTLEQIASLARSLRVLADYLEQHPEALIRGKKPDKGE